MGEKIYTCTVCNAVKGEKLEFNGISKEKWNNIIDLASFDNVTFQSVANITGQPNDTDITVVKIDNNKYLIDDEKAEEDIRNIQELFIKTSLAIVSNFENYDYDKEKDQYVSNTTIIYSVNMIVDDTISTTATITVNDAIIKLDNEMGFNLRKDVRSSVPRLTLSLNSGRWIDEDIDIYKLINDELFPGEEFTEERREGIKALHMSAYFDEGSAKYLGKNVYFRMDKVDVDKKEVDEFISRMKEAVIKVEGGFLYGNEIFYVESCIYLMTLYDLLCSYHKKVWLVYDSFYSIGNESQEEYEHMIKDGIRINFNEFMEKVLGFDIKKVLG